MDEFLSTFQESCQAENAHLTELENQINHALINLGKNQSFMHFIPRYFITQELSQSITDFNVTAYQTSLLPKRAYY